MRGCVQLPPPWRFNLYQTHIHVQTSDSAASAEYCSSPQTPTDRWGASPQKARLLAISNLLLLGVKLIRTFSVSVTGRGSDVHVYMSACTNDMWLLSLCLLHGSISSSAGLTWKASIVWATVRPIERLWRKRVGHYGAQVVTAGDFNQTSDH